MSDPRTNLPTIDDLAAQMHMLLPGFAARAAETERLRKLPPESFRALRESGLLRFFVPARFGGYEMPFRHHLALPSALGRVCGSTAWVYAVALCHGGFATRFPLAAQEEIWGDDPDRVCANANAGKAEVREAEGGFIVSGRWKFSSGVDYADFVLLRAPTPGVSGKPGFSRFIVSKDQYRVEDTWHAVGLKGSGSNDVVVEEAFVPKHRWRTEDALGFNALPAEPLPPNPWGQAEYVPYFATSIIGPLLGAAEGALAEYADATRVRAGQLFGERIADQLPVQTRLAESAAEVRMGRLLAESTTALLAAAAETGTRLAGEDRLTWKRDNALLATLLVRAVDRLASMMGATGQMEGNAVQRHLRDAKAIAAHGSLQWDASLSPYGRWLLGVPTGDPVLDAAAPAPTSH